MSIIWSDLAIEDLNDIEDYIARDNPARAVSFVDELIDLGDSLSNEGEAEKGTLANGFVIRMCVNCTTRIILSCTRFVVTILLFMKYIIPQNCLDNFEAGNNKNTERPQFQAMMDVADLFGFSK